MRIAGIVNLILHSEPRLGSWMGPVAAAFLFVPSLMSQPTVTAKSLESDGVRLLLSTDPEFTRNLHPQRAKEFDVLAPYAALIANDTDQEILGYSVRWLWTDESGKTAASEFTASDFQAAPGNGFGPRTARFVSYFQDFGTERLRWDLHRQGETERMLSIFQKQRSVSISIEAVVFADGTAIGEDHNNWIPKWRASIDADRDVTTSATQVSPEHFRTLAQQWISAGIMLLRPHRKEEPTEANLPSGLALANNYDEAYIYHRALVAKYLIWLMDNTSERSTIEKTRNRLAATRRLNIHRKGAN